MLPTDLSAPDRVRFAIKKSGRTLVELSKDVGCSYAALSQWQTGATNLQNVKAGLLLCFALRTDVDLMWLLTGTPSQEAGDSP